MYCAAYPSLDITEFLDLKEICKLLELVSTILCDHLTTLNQYHAIVA